MRSWARGYRCGVFQFVKSGKWKVGEAKAAAALGGIDWEKMGDGWSWISHDLDESADLRARGLGGGQARASPRSATSSCCSTRSPTRSTGAGSTSTTSSRRCATGPASSTSSSPAATRPGADRRRRPRLRGRQGQAPDGRRASAPSRGSSGRASSSSSTGPASRGTRAADEPRARAHAGARRAGAARGADPAAHGAGRPRRPARRPRSRRCSAGCPAAPVDRGAVEAAARGHRRARRAAGVARGRARRRRRRGRGGAADAARCRALRARLPRHAVHHLRGHRLLLVGRAAAASRRPRPRPAAWPRGHRSRHGCSTRQTVIVAARGAAAGIAPPAGRAVVVPARRDGRCAPISRARRPPPSPRWRRGRVRRRARGRCRRGRPRQRDAAAKVALARARRPRAASAPLAESLPGPRAPCGLPRPRLRPGDRRARRAARPDLTWCAGARRRRRARRAASPSARSPLAVTDLTATVRWRRRDPAHRRRRHQLRRGQDDGRLRADRRAARAAG